jgi:hypothetical protein
MPHLPPTLSSFHFFTLITWDESLILSDAIFLPTAYSPALICFERERGWWITCNYRIVLKGKKHRETERVQPVLSVG